MHVEIQAEKDNIDKTIDDCGVEWDAHKHLEVLKLQKAHYGKLRARILGEEWTGSKPGEPDTSFADFDAQFRPMTKLRYHSVLGEDDPVILGPTAEDTGHAYLGANLRDMTGVLHSVMHKLTHDAKRKTNADDPCWCCIKAASSRPRPGLDAESTPPRPQSPSISRQASAAKHQPPSISRQTSAAKRQCCGLYFPSVGSAKG